MIKIGQTYKTTAPWGHEMWEPGLLLEVTGYEKTYDSGEVWCCTSGRGDTWVSEEDIRCGNVVLLPNGLLPDTIILLNAPKGAGKDVIASGIAEATGMAHMEFKAHLYQCTATLFNIPLTEIRELATDRVTKEVPNELFTVSFEAYQRVCYITGDTQSLATLFQQECPETVALSPRQALIYVSECVVKPNLGEEYFGKIASSNISKNLGAVFSDSGFIEELMPLIEEHGAENIFVVQFSRDGTSFDGDSRNYLDVPEGVASVRMVNDRSIQEFVDDVLEWIAGEKRGLPGDHLCTHL